MKVKSLLGATLVDEAKAIAIIDYCLFGPQPMKTSIPPCRKHIKKRPKTTALRPFTATYTNCPLDNVVLQKHTPAQEKKPVMASRPTDIPTLWQPRQGLNFPCGLCYLLAVQEHNWPSATVELGYYQTVADLQCSHLVEKFSTFLVAQEPGLYHMKGRFVQGAITLFQAQTSWKVGAHLPNHLHPGHNAGYPQRPIVPARPPLPPQSVIAPLVPLGIPTPKPKFKGKPKQSRGPFHPYAPPPAHKHPSSPAAQWKRALTDPLDEAMDSFKAELDIFLSTLAVPAWKDMMAYLKDKKRQENFDRKACIPALTEFFTTVLDKVKSEYSAIQG